MKRIEVQITKDSSPIFLLLTLDEESKQFSHNFVRKNPSSESIEISPREEKFLREQISLEISSDEFKDQPGQRKLISLRNNDKGMGLSDPAKIKIIFAGGTEVVEVKYSGGELNAQIKQRINPTLYRLAGQGVLLTKTVELPQQADGKLKYTPKTDLHTHFAGIMSADILLTALQKKAEKKENVIYDMKVLSKFELDLKIYAPTVTEIEKKDDKTGKVIGSTFDLAAIFNVRFRPGSPEASIHEQNLAKIKNCFHIPKDKVIIFEKMEEYYDYRDPLVKDPSLFPFYLMEIAKEYKAMGIEYVEISFSKVNDPQYLKMIYVLAKQIKKDYGIEMRFLGTIARVASSAKRDTSVALFKQVASLSPDVAGIDLLAAEINSTYDMLDNLYSVAEWSRAYYPKDLVIRVHAGEMSYHPENIEGVLSLAEKYPDVIFRAGHGMYGCHDSVVSRIHKLQGKFKSIADYNFYPEINMSSNVALNTLADIGSHTVFLYLKKEIPLFLGSDGHGLYQSTPEDLIEILTYSVESEAKSLLTDFLEEKSKVSLPKTESGYILRMKAVQQERQRLFYKNFSAALIKIPPKDPKYSDAYQELKDKVISGLEEAPTENELNQKICELAEQMIYREAAAGKPRQTYFDVGWDEIFKGYSVLKSNLLQHEAKQEAKSIELEVKNKQEKQEFCHKRNISYIPYQERPEFFGKILPRMIDELKDKTPIMITGIIYEKEDDLKSTKAMIMTMLETMDPEKFYFATTGTDIGISKMVHDMVNKYNRELPEGASKFNIVGYVPEKTKSADISDRLTHVVEVPGSIYNTYQLIAELTKEHGLKMIVAGGGTWNRDSIQVVRNEVEDWVADVLPVASPMAPAGLAAIPAEAKSLKSDRLFLLRNVRGASRDKARELDPKFSYDNFSDVLIELNQNQALLRAGKTVADVRQSFDEHLSVVSSEKGILREQGRVPGSTPEEIVRKVLKSLGFPRLVSDEGRELKAEERKEAPSGLAEAERSGWLIPQDSHVEQFLIDVVSVCLGYKELDEPLKLFIKKNLSKMELVLQKIEAIIYYQPGMDSIREELSVYHKESFAISRQSGLSLMDKKSRKNEDKEKLTRSPLGEREERLEGEGREGVTPKDKEEGSSFEPRRKG